MSNFSDNPAMVRVDLWKASGKWYTTLAVDMGPDHWRGLDATPHKALAAALRATLEPGSFAGMTATCLEPYHEFSHPISLEMDQVWAGRYRQV